MNIFFDVDSTLLAMDGSLRPGSRDTFEQLIEDGHTIYIWSGVGIRTREIEKVGLIDLVEGLYQKPIEDFDDGIEKFGVPLRPDFVIDDHPEIVRNFGGVLIRPYYFPTREDEEMGLVYKVINEVVETGTSTHRIYKAPKSNPSD